ncbi:PDPN [Cervus elaphus hippelaphus]|uniref:PDPN n=1 Tax=Cervus elaphus hippelaphus TaxID=46360 RepID=A0A212CRA8_CEREH|nr:PDPN [Cervus elaphus hippelaphus]
MNQKLSFRADVRSAHDFTLRSDSISPFSASTVRPEDDVTTGVKNEKTTLGVEDYLSTPAASKEPLATPRPTGTENVTQSHREDLPTGESTTAKSTPAQSTTAKTTVHTHVPATSHSQGEKNSHPSGLSVGTVVAIIVGVLLGITVIGIIIRVIYRKMSGRYS